MIIWLSTGLIIIDVLYTDTQSGNGLSGSPLTQLLEYALHHNCPEVIDNEIVQLLVKTPLDVNVIYFLWVMDVCRDYWLGEEQSLLIKKAKNMCGTYY